MLRGFLCVGVIAFFGSQVEAGLLNSVLTFNGQTDQINTLNNPAGSSGFIDNDSSGDLTDGDIVVGFIVSRTTKTDVTLRDPFNAGSPVVGGTGTEHNLTGDQLIAAVFSGVVTMTGTNDDSFLTAIDPGIGSGYSINELLTGFDGVGKQLQGVSDAVVAVLSGAPSGGASSLFAATLASFTSGNFFDNSVYDLEFAAELGGGFFQSLDRTSGEFRTRAGLNVIQSTQDGGIGSQIKFVPEQAAVLFGVGDGTYDLALDNTGSFATSPTGFQFSIESSSIRMNAVPEPASILAFVGLAGVVACRRRRKNG